jgi:putative transposase
MSRYRRAPIPGATYFFTLNTYRLQALLTHAEVLTALHSAHRVVRATHPFHVEAMVILPDNLHAVWSLPPEDAEYSTRLSLLKRHVSQRVRHLLSASRHKRRELALWQRRFWEHQI